MNKSTLKNVLDSLKPINYACRSNNLLITPVTNTLSGLLRITIIFPERLNLIIHF